MKPKVISEKVVYKSPLTKVISGKVKLSNGNIVEWDWIDNADGVAVLPVDKDGNVYLVKEWRAAWKKDVIQITAGSCVTEDEKIRIEQVHNELREEIGMDAKKVEKLISGYASGRINYQIHVYLATDLFPSKKDPDQDEILEVIKMPFKEAYDLFVSGKEKTTSYTLLAFLLADRYLQLP